MLRRICLSADFEKGLVHFMTRLELGQGNENKLLWHRLALRSLRIVQSNCKSLSNATVSVQLKVFMFRDEIF